MGKPGAWATNYWRTVKRNVKRRQNGDLRRQRRRRQIAFEKDIQFSPDIETTWALKGKDRPVINCKKTCNNCDEGEGRENWGESDWLLQAFYDGKIGIESNGR